MPKKGRVNCAEMPCNTKSIVIPFRVTVAQWKLLIRKAGGKGKVSNYIRQRVFGKKRVAT